MSQILRFTSRLSRTVFPGRRKQSNGLESPCYITRRFLVLTALLLALLAALHAADPVPLWDERLPLLKTAELPVRKDVRFSVIKPYEFEKDGYRFLHGVGLCFHEGRLYASFGHNQGGENTDTEEGRFCVSEDNGKTWDEVVMRFVASHGTWTFPVLLLASPRSRMGSHDEHGIDEWLTSSESSRESSRTDLLVTMPFVGLQ